MFLHVSRIRRNNTPIVYIIMQVKITARQRQQIHIYIKVTVGTASSLVKPPREIGRELMTWIVNAHLSRVWSSPAPCTTPTRRSLRPSPQRTTRLGSDVVTQACHVVVYGAS